MSLITQIKSDRFHAMKAKQTVAKNILTTLLGELEGNSKRSGTPMTDDAVIKLCKKFITTNTTTINNLTGHDSKASHVNELVTENTVLMRYVPQQLTTDELSAIITTLDTKNIGEVMKHLSLHYKGLFDGNEARKIIQQL